MHRSCSLLIFLLGIFAFSCQAPEASVRPGINQGFLEASESDMAEFVEIFEGESQIGRAHV